MAFKLRKVDAAALEALVNKYARATEELNEWLQNVLDEWQGAFDEKSDKWRDSDAGSAAQERIDLIQSWIDELEITVNPDDLL